MKPGIKKGSVAARSLSEALTDGQERGLGKVGPGTYAVPQEIGATKVRLRHHQFFGSSTNRFFDSVFDKGVGNLKPGIAPGSYEEPTDIKQQESAKKKDYKETQEIV